MLFLGTLFKKEDETEILKLSKVGIANADNTFQWNLINGLKMHLPLEIINILPVGAYPFQYKKIFLETKRWGDKKENIEIGSINVHFLKQFIRYKKVKKEIYERLGRGKITNIMIYSTYLPFIKAVYKLDRSIRVTLIVTDIPAYYDINKVGLVNKVLRRINNYFVYRYLSRIDSFVLLTEEMKVPMKVGKRDFVVVEGIADSEKFVPISCSNAKKTILLYAGTLNYQYGITSLLGAMEFIENENYELWICGSGEAEKDVIDMAKVDQRIKYLGYLVRDELFKLMQKTTLLINPRTNEGEYTKYSFPSKTMEYMISGKPVLMYKLDGIPDEYDRYLYYFDGADKKDIASKIVEICEKPQSELKAFGERARQYVLEKKSGVVQAGKIVKMIEETKSNGKYS